MTIRVYLVTLVAGLNSSKVVARVEQPRNGDLERGHRLRPVAAAVVLEDDRAGRGVLHDVGDDLADPRPGPVPGVDRPVERHQVLARAVLERRARPGAVGRAEDGRGAADRVVDGVGGVPDLGPGLRLRER